MNSTSRIIYLPRLSRLSGQIRSRVRTPDIAYDTVCEILACYGLELTAPPQNLPNARRNRNLIVYTSAGKKIIKLYRSDWKISTIHYEHSILNRLAQLGFPAPRLAQAENGETYLHLGNSNYAIFDFADGTNYSISYLVRKQRLILMQTAGQTLASLHKRLQGFLPEGQHHLGFKSYTADRHRDMAWHIQKVEELEAKSRTITDPRAVQPAGRLIQERDFILTELGRLDEALNRAPLPRLIIHGDYGLHNLLFQNLGQATPVDFELARLEWRLSDLVSCLSKFRFGNGPYDFESQRHFMYGYQKEYPLDGDEWQLLPAVWRYYRFMGAVQYWSSYFETGGPARKLISACDALDQAVWAKIHPKKILGLIAK